MNRFQGIESALKSAHRMVDSETGELRDVPTNLEPGTPTQIDFPISPGLERAIHAVVTEAIEAKLSFFEACARVRAVLDKYGMALAQDDEAGHGNDDTTL